MSNFEDSAPVVRAEDDGKKKKKMKTEIIVIAVVAVLIVIAVIVTVIAVRAKNKGGDVGETVSSEEAGDTAVDKLNDFEPVTFTEDVEVTFEGVSTDFSEEFEAHQFETAVTTAYKPEVQKTTVKSAPTTKKEQITTAQYLEQTTVKTTTPASSDKSVLSDINSFFNGTYYFDGTMISGGEKTPMEVAMNGSDFQVFSEMEGMDIAVMNYGGKMYLMNPDNMKYTEINSALKSMMGLSEDAFTFEFSKIKFDGNSPTSVTDATYMGQKAVCYTYKDGTNHMEFIAVNNEVRQITMYENGDSAKTVLQADEFSAQIPDDMMSFKGYSKTNMISFMKDFM